MNLRTSQDNPLDSILDQRNIEIDQQTKSFLGELEIRQELRIKEREHCLNRLQLDNH